ncbi:MAG: hypothetical protein ACYTFI_21775, partial [Planctomycetota bacterium]
MKRIAVVAMTVLQTTQCAFAASGAEVFVAKGEPKAVRESGGRWKRGAGYLECSGPDRYLYAAKELAGGDFHIRARLSLAKFGRTAASFVLGGDHFGFDGGNDGQLFVEGPTFGRTRMLGPARSRISPGRPFEFEAICKAGRLTVRIDGREVYSTVFRGVAVGSFGFRPWRGTMRVHDFSADGRFTKPLASTDVFVSGQDGYNTYRIPSVIVTKGGALLAFAEG